MGKVFNISKGNLIIEKNAKNPNNNNKTAMPITKDSTFSTER